MKKMELKLNIKKPEFSFEKIKQADYRGFIKRLFSGRSLLILLIAFIVLINYLSLSYFIRLDATDTQLYSLSPATKEIISNLSDEVVIEVFFSDNTPPNLLEAKQNVLDLLEEFAKASGGKIKVDIKNPTSSDFETLANSRGIQQIQYSEYSDDKFLVAQGFLGLAFVKGDSVETIPVITSLDNLEYEVTSRIMKLTKSQEIKVGFFTKQAETKDGLDGVGTGASGSVFDNYSDIRELLERQYLTGEVDLSLGKPIDPKEFPVVVVVAPKSALSQRDFFELEQYAFNGGRLLVLEDLFRLSFNMPILSKTGSNLNEFLKNYGLEVESKVLLDESFTPIISQNTKIAYPFWILVGGDGINSEIPPLNELSSVTFLWANPIKKEEKTGLEYTELFNTTKFAWTETGESIDIDFKDFKPADQKKYTVSYMVKGSAKSQFSEIPALESKTGNDARVDKDNVLTKTENFEMVVIGDADFVADNFMGANEQNSVMFLNLIDWLSNAEDLSSIRSKSITTRPLATLDTDTKAIYKVVNSAVAPVSIALFGLIYLKRRKSKPSAI